MRTLLHEGLLCHLQGDNDKLASIYATALVELAQAKSALDTVHADVDSLQAGLLPHAVWDLEKEPICLQALLTYACMCWQSPAKLRELRIVQRNKFPGVAHFTSNLQALRGLISSMLDTPSLPRRVPSRTPLT
jgi:hypothetical protein